MEERVHKLLAEMQNELARGQQVMADLEQRQANLRETMLQIRGAITALNMLLNDQGSAADSEPVASVSANGIEELAAAG